MSELLIELFSEEIPARMQVRAADDFARAVNKSLLDAGYMPEGVMGLGGPRRLTCVVAGLPARQPDRREEKKGPRVGAPEKAVEGFLRSAGLTSLDQCEKRSDKKGEFYVAVIEEAGRETADVIAETLPGIIRGFSWAKSQRWGDGDLRWVRPLHKILCVFDGEPVRFDLDGIAVGDETQGHRFMAPAPITARSYEDYAGQLRNAKVVLDAGERQEIIAADAATLCKAQGLELVEDRGLLAEVAGLAEWPIAMMGSFDEKFLSLPDEVLTASMRGHQKYFSVRDPKTGRLANKFICVANIEAPDGGAAMRTGYERVLTARLSDGWFLYNQDLKVKLEERVADLDKITFFDGLGSVGDKARRIAALAKEIAPAVGADADEAERAAMLAKADLVSGMVYEFPELQGLMGRYYALEEGADAVLADAIRDHYKPAGQDDDVPTAPVSVAVALADKIDTLTAFWAIGAKPTGSSDPFALRRACLGVIRTTLENKLRICLTGETGQPYDAIMKPICDAGGIETSGHDPVDWEEFASPEKASYKFQFSRDRFPLNFAKTEGVWLRSRTSSLGDLLSFFHDRLKVYLKDQGHRHDHVDAVRFGVDGSLSDDLVLIVSKLDALAAFLKTDDGANLAAAYKRAANILKAEEKKGALPESLIVDASVLTQDEEKALFAALETAEADAAKAVKAEDFEGAMKALASLRAPIDAFFEGVIVNDENARVRANRLALLDRFIKATASVADFAKLEG